MFTYALKTWGHHDLGFPERQKPRAKPNHERRGGELFPALPRPGTGAPGHAPPCRPQGPPVLPDRLVGASFPNVTSRQFLFQVYRLMPSAPSPLVLRVPRPAFMSKCTNPGLPVLSLQPLFLLAYLLTSQLLPPMQPLPSPPPSFSSQRAAQGLLAERKRCPLQVLSNTK